MQSRQTMTNVLQLLVPIICLIIQIFLTEAMVEGSSLFLNQELNFPIPYFYNIPLKPLSSLGLVYNVSSCNEWYMYSFNNEVAT